MTNQAPIPASLSEVLLPRKMPVDLALHLSEVLTGLGQRTLPTRLLAMMLMHTSWVAQARSLAEHIEIVNIMGDTDLSELLNLLSRPDVFGARESLEAAEAYLGVVRLRRSLEESSTKTEATFTVVLNCLTELLTQVTPYDARLVAEELQGIIMAYELSREAAPVTTMRGAANLDWNNPAHQRHLLARLDSEATTALFAPSGAGAATVAPSAIVGGQPIWNVPDAYGRMRLAGYADEHCASPAPAAPEKPERTPDAVRIFDPADARRALERTPAMRMPGDGNARQAQLLEEMASSDGFRGTTQVPKSDCLAELRAAFPHFEPVIDFIDSALALAACGGENRVTALPPLLLRGEPGTGKTYFAQELARVLGTYFIERDLSVTTEAFVISGMDSSWKNSKPGIVFDALVHGKTANPLVCLNEVDKAYTTGSHNSPLAPLYALLEPTSSAKFRDEFVPVDVDASRVIWVLTANDGPIPDPILSRLEVFQIPTPTQHQCRAIAQSVWASLCRKHFPAGHSFSMELSEGQLAQICKMSPRVMRKALTHAASLAARAHRNELTEQELTVATRRYSTPSRAPIGFTG